MDMVFRDRRAERQVRTAARPVCAWPLVLAAVAGCRPAAPVAPAPPTGGVEYVYDAARFAADVAPVLGARGCDTVACHGGGIRGTFALSPVGDKDLDFDFAQAVLQVDGDDPAASPLLRKASSAQRCATWLQSIWAWACTPVKAKAMRHSTRAARRYSATGGRVWKGTMERCMAALPQWLARPAQCGRTWGIVEARSPAALCLEH